MSTVWQDIVRNAISLRRELHQHPELGWQEQGTAERIRQQLTALDIPWRVCAKTGTVACLNAGSSGRHIALRGDIDALPIVEQTELDWASHTSGCMHACGHDGHTATLIAAASWLKAHEAELPGPVTLIFQPAEEGGHGAREMIHDGALENVDEIFGWHNWPALPFGELICPDGIVMCGNGTFSIRVIGQGGHASQPELCRDPVLGASAITLALQQVVSRRLAPQASAVLSITSIEAPSAATVIPGEAKLGGSIRVPDENTRQQLNQLIEEIAQQTATAYGLQCEVECHPRYQATINHADAASRVRHCWRQLYGSDAINHSLPVPIMASEDFSYYLREIPGAFALIGADDGNGHDAPCHSAYYDFNDQLIPKVVRLYAALAGAADDRLG